MTRIMEEARTQHTVTVNEENKIRVKKLLTEAVTLLCKNSIPYGAELNIEGLLGITVDASDVYLVNINEKVKNDANSESVYSTVESSDASYIKRWRHRLHSGHELLHRKRHNAGITPTVNDENPVVDDVIHVKTECLDEVEDNDVANISKYGVESNNVAIVAEVSHDLVSTMATSRTFENNIDIADISSLSPVHCADRYSSHHVSDAPVPVSCANRENSTSTRAAVPLDTNNFQGIAVDSMELASLNTPAQQTQALADVPFCKPNLVKSLPQFLNVANQFQLRHSTSDTWSEQRNNDADFVVLDTDASQFFDGTASRPVNTMTVGGEKSLSGHESSEMTDLCSDEKKHSFLSPSQMRAHHGTAAYTYSPMMCKVCGRVLRNRTIYMRHIKTHMGCMYSCHVCSRKFNRKDSLKRHYLMLHKYDMWPNSAVETCVT